MHVSVVVVVVVVRRGVMGKAGCQIKLCWVKSFMPKEVCKIEKNNVLTREGHNIIEKVM